MGISGHLGTTWILGLGLASMMGATGCAAELDVAAPAAVIAARADAPAASVRAALDPYGRWITVAGYGEVWQPNVAVVGVDFVPYASAGSWVSTDAGWAFESDYAWGWAPFHYGHWLRESAVGWIWVPGTTWTPAAVEWRTGGGLVGWAPSPPPGVEVRPEHFTFVETARLTDHDLVKIALPEYRREAAFRATVVMPVEVRAGVRVAARGPRVEEIEAATGHKIEVRHVEAPRAGLIAEVHVRGAARVDAGGAVREDARAGEEHREAAQRRARQEREAADRRPRDERDERDEKTAARERANAARGERAHRAAHVRTSEGQIPGYAGRRLPKSGPATPAHHS